MEFVTSRAMLVVCGVVLMAAVAVPMSQLFDTDENDRMSELAVKDAEAVDALLDSGYDEVYLRGASLLPGAGYRLVLDGHALTVYSPEGRTYTSATSHSLDRIELGYGDVVTVTCGRGS